MKSITIGDHVIQKYKEPFIIAEFGANFNGDFITAEKMLEKAREAGVHCAKFQSFTKETIMIEELYAGKEADITSYGHRRLEDLIDHLTMDEAEHVRMKELCDKYGLLFSSTPISRNHVDMLVDLDASFLKIASMDLNHLSFIEYIGKKQRPTILSTGMGDLAEIRRAVEVFLDTGNDQLVLLHCTSLYPPNDEEINLHNMDMLAEEFGLPVGYSDHTIGYTIPLAAVARGAAVIEKHYTLDKTMAGWDHAVSATPEEFAVIVGESGRICRALGSRKRNVTEREEAQKAVFRRSIVAAADLEPGRAIQFEDLDFKRPGTGIAPDQYSHLIGRILTSAVAKDTLLKWEDFE